MSQEVESITQQVLEVYERWLSRELRLYPLLVAYTYFMNIDPVITVVLKACKSINNIVEFKTDLSTVRKLIYISAQEDYESPIIRDATFVDRVKSEICRRLSEKYCAMYREYLARQIERCDVWDKIKLGVVLRVFEKQRLLEGTVTRVNVRFDLLQGWIRGFTDALQDLEQRDAISRFVAALTNIDLYELVNMKIPVGYATSDVIIYPTCLEDVVMNLVREYANAQKIIQLCSQQG